MEQKFKVSEMGFIHTSVFRLDVNVLDENGNVDWETENVEVSVEVGTNNRGFQVVKSVVIEEFYDCDESYEQEIIDTVTKQINNGEIELPTFISIRNVYSGNKSVKDKFFDWN